ncbi:glycosyltransferase [Tenacibaculum finnmarkense]|uniref:glycosyltransferase n=1 Tax=Tenacibaculum finnmarkense TaxID=2781243 RepID=UPI001EFBD62E|nr:glycosyltransferase [Tenacibaculum finnmarkense]MCG8236935.1 glycosyltransferase [Tenacibaculum finnmarkense genomovar ulcerans]MCG8749735.1 glycosyltransferase [Tenacibaculum finnmarkense]MCG8754852.1 glycosyltransferase [Tenacibaculum finnmarkense]MCG8783764.1 glycosyltransferase [Tenacibaculum finnmarkense]MCG8831033.1 glycosyltransferase [Tenacibaculum finnmarkense]
MKILQIINSLETGGAEKLIVDSTPVYDKQLKTVNVLLLKDSQTKFREKLESKNIQVKGLTKGSLYSPLLIFKIIPFFKKYDIIHAHLFPTLYWVVLAKLISFSKISIVYTEHSTNNKRRNNIIFKLIDKFIYAQLSKIGCISEGTFTNLEKHIGSSEKLSIITNGILLDDFKNLQVKQKALTYDFFSKEDFVLIQVSSFREQKDQKTLIKSLQLLPEKVKLLLVGDGHLRKENEALVKELGLVDSVKFLGNRYDIPELMNYADVVVLSSIYEGFGLVVVEGMAAGKPVVASNVSGVKEIVENNGLLFEVTNEKELSQKIAILMNEKNYAEVADKCYLKAQDYSIKEMVDNYIKIYKVCTVKN